MDFRGLDLNLLVALHALLSEKSVTRAGMRIHRSQSATSAALSRLREFFKDDLLVQVGREMVLTRLGQSLAEPVQEALLRVQSTIVAKASFDPATSNRRFSIMAPDELLAPYLAEIVPRLTREAPGIGFDLFRREPSYLDYLERGEIDFLVVPDVFASEAHPKQALLEETLRCLVWTENPLVGQTISMEQYLESGHVSTAYGRSQQPGFDEWFLRRRGHARRLEILAPSYTSAALLLVGTNRVWTGPARLAASLAKCLPLRMVPPPLEIPPVTIMLQWHRLHDGDAGSRWLRYVFLSAAAAA
jgi:DNA-binding transcriptional LysR family regulator